MRWRHTLVGLVIGCNLACLGVQSAGPASQTPEPGHRTQSLNLAMGQWRFVAIGNTQVVTTGRQQPYLKFEESTHIVTAFTGCNRLRGGYKADETIVSFERVREPFNSRSRISHRRNGARDASSLRSNSDAHFASEFSVGMTDFEVICEDGGSCKSTPPLYDRSLSAFERMRRYSDPRG